MTLQAYKPETVILTPSLMLVPTLNAKPDCSLFPETLCHAQAARALLNACEAAAARAWSSALPGAFAGAGGRPRLVAMLRVAVTETADGTAAGGPGEARRLLARCVSPVACRTQSLAICLAPPALAMAVASTMFVCEVASMRRARQCQHSANRPPTGELADGGAPRMTNSR